MGKIRSNLSLPNLAHGLTFSVTPLAMMAVASAYITESLEIKEL
ncbi:hypothetical protein [Crinalium epipsammum]|nr:hypothetical protein [Crinalium epipsammum]